MASNHDLVWLSKNGEMAKMIRAKDWSKTAFGPIEEWPSSLKTILGVALGSRFPMLIWWGPELLHLYNDAYRPILRDKHPSSLGAPAAKIWAEVWDVAGPMAKGVMDGGPATWTEDLQLFVKSGAIDAEETFFTFSYSPIPGEDGKVAGILNTVQETTAKVQGERQIQMLHNLAADAADAKSEEEAYQKAMEVLSASSLDVPFALLFLLDPDTDMLRLASSAGLANYKGAATDPSKWPFEKIIETSDELVIDNLSKHFGKLPESHWGSRPESAIILPLKHAGRSRPEAFLVIGISPHRKLDDKYHQFFRATADQVTTIIANARAYEAEAKRAEELAALDKAKTVFFSNVSHEFRTPLTLMLGPLEESLQRSDLPSDHVERLNLMHRNTLRLQKLVNSLLDFSRIEAGKMKATYQPVDLASYSKELASSFESAVSEAKLEFIINCSPLKHKAYVDLGQWETIVLNLLSNALKFTFKGHIKIEVRESKKYAELIIEDTGTGISQTELQHLFERFHRISGAKSRTAEGSGIGLALVQELVKLHGGTISAESKVGKGTIFKVRIPFGTSHLPKDQVVRTEVPRDVVPTTSSTFTNEAMGWFKKATTANMHTGKNPAITTLKSRWDETILVVDDNADMREYIYRILNTNSSLQVDSAANGQAALKLIKKRMPSIIITDIMMPEMNGFELVNTIRKDPAAAHIPIVFLSARAGEKERVEGIAEGIDVYLTKPFSANELVTTVNTLLNLSLIRRRAYEEETKVLRDLNNAKDEFISIVSHQLRTPATGVKQYLGILQQGFAGSLTPKQHEALNHANESNERQLRIIDSLLKVAQIDAGKVKPQKALTDLAKLTSEVLDEQQPKINGKKQTIVFQPPKTSTNVSADPRLIRMVIENLIDNASKYSPAGRNIAVNLSFDTHDAILSVKDEGVGISKHDLNKLFKKFSRIDDKRSKTVDGNGLGLYWVKKVMEAHNGSIEVSSAPNEGSNFMIKLPLKVDKSRHLSRS